MHNTDLIITLTVGLTVGLIFGYITNRLRLSPIVGYLLAGVVIGPFTPGYIADLVIAQQLAEIGVMLLMFGVGLHFHLKDLLAVKSVAIPGAIAQIAVATLLGYLVANYFDWTFQTGIIFGLALSVASTVVLTRVLVDNRALHSPTGHVAIGWLIVEDIFTVIALVLLPIFFGSQSADANLPVALGIVALKFLGLAAAILILGAKVIPWLFTRVAESYSQELFTLTVLVTALGIAVGSAMVFDVSMALGAFLAGMVVGKSEFSQRAASEALPLRDAFAALFFVSVGMLLDPHILIDNIWIVLATLFVVIVGKGVAAFLIVILLGYPIAVALGVSVALAQIGEFSFILASVGKDLGVFSELATNTLVAVAIISITLNPILYCAVKHVDKWIASKPRLYALLTICLNKRLPDEVINPDPYRRYGQHHAIIVGFGPIGRIVSRLLQDNGLTTAVIELNLETARELNEQGLQAVYGNAEKRETLLAAGVEKAKTLVISASSVTSAEEVVRVSKELNPSINIIARTAYLKDLVNLKISGCEAVYSGEGEVALALVGEVLRSLGATEEQVQREQRRTKKELNGQI